MKKKKKLEIIFVLTLWLAVELIHNWLSISGNVFKNYGISFGLNGSFFIGLNILFILFLSGIWWKQKFVGLNLLLIGGWVNLMDRMTLGYVRDYWQLGGGVYNNLADWLISVGVITILWELWIKKSE